MESAYAASSRASGIMSSPANAHANGLLSPTRNSQRKEKRNPSVTPRRFGRFFTPRSTITGRRILGNLDSSATNRQPLSPESLFSDPLTADTISPSPTKRLGITEDGTKKRRWEQEDSGPVVKRRAFLPDQMPPPPLNFMRTTQPFEDQDLPMLDAPIGVTMQERDAAGNRRRATLVCWLNYASFW